MKQVIASQIDGSIDLLIRFDNLTGAYLLAATAINNLWTTAKKENRRLPLDISRVARERMPDKERDLMQRFHRAYNEMKHIGSIDFQTHFNPATAEAHILTATLSYDHFFKRLTPRMSIYSNWMMHRHPFLQSADFEPVDVLANIPEGGTRAERAAPAKTLLEDHDKNPQSFEDMIDLVQRIRSMTFKDTL